MNAFNLLQRCNVRQVRGGRARLACRWVAVVGTLVLSLSALGAPQADERVVTTADDDGPGSLRQALAAADSGDTITFDAGLTGQTISLTSGELEIGTNLTITGLGAGNLAISGNSASRVFVVREDVTATIQEVTISDGHSTDVGGGILNLGTLTVTNSTVSDNSAGDAGGGIANFEGTLTVSDSLFSGNSVTETPNSTLAGGGGIAAAGTLTITNSTFSGNSVIGIEPPGPQSDNGFGGGILFGGGTLTVTNSTFSGNSVTNTSSGGGGGISAAGTLTVTNSTFSGNSVTNTFNPFFSGGGGIRISGGEEVTTLTVRNSTFSGNSVSSTGGGIGNIGGTLTVTHSTFSGNSAEEGGGIANFEGTLTLANTILANSLSGGDCLNDDGLLTPAGVNLVEDGSCGASADPTHFLTGDPQLGPLAPNGGPTQTHALLVGSPAIDAVPMDQCPPPADDQRGVARPQGATCDIGAFELEAGFTFSGFFQPVDNPPTFNGLKAGSAVPVKFSLGGDEGLQILAVGSPTSQPINCDATAPLDPVPTVTAGNSSLSYDPTTQTYTYVWKTDKAWAGTCRRLDVQLIDGLHYRALFNFK